MLGGSWVVISRVVSRVTILITQIKRLITLLIATSEPALPNLAPNPSTLNAKSKAP